MTKITDGEAVAKLLLDGYLNNFQTVHQDFMEIMAGQKREIRENCTYLGFAWLKGLSEVSYYDLRNEASKHFGLGDIMLRQSAISQRMQ